MLRWLDDARDPLNRDSFDPGHAVASAFLVSTDGCCVALIHHLRLGRWLQPGGHAQWGEHDPAAVAAREAHEELGVAIEPDALELFDLDVHTIPAGRSAPEHLHFDLRFLGSVPPEDLHAATDAIDARWFSAPQVRALNVDRGLERMLDKALARGLLRP